MVLLGVVAAGCGERGGGPRSPAASIDYHGGPAPASQAADAAMLHVHGGQYIAGSTATEREAAYQSALETSGNDRARRGGWFEREQERHTAELAGFSIDRTPVTVAAYAEFVSDTGAPAPTIDRATWKRQGFIQDYDRDVTRYNWVDGAPPPGRDDHPVVLVTYAEAAQYCAWRGKLVGQPRRLPSAAEFEKAARGERGDVYPWGLLFDPARLNSAVEGPRDTVPVGQFESGKSPYGALDMAGNVFQWTRTVWPHSEGRQTVKGSAWDDHGGVGRGASQHGRRNWVRHAIVGFRCAGPAAGD